MNITNLILIVGCVYISLVQKSNSTRNMMLLLTGLIAFCMLDFKEGYCTLPITLQNPNRSASCVEVSSAGALVPGSPNCNAASSSPTCDAQSVTLAAAATGNHCKYIPAGTALVPETTDGQTGSSILGRIATCGDAGPATINATALATCDSDSQATILESVQDLGCPSPATTPAIALTTPCSAAPSSWLCDSGHAKILGQDTNGVYYQSPPAGASGTSPAWKNACCSATPPPPPPAPAATDPAAYVLLDPVSYVYYEAQCEEKVREKIADETITLPSGVTEADEVENALEKYGKTGATQPIPECGYAYSWRYNYLGPVTGDDYWSGTACVPPIP